jgi:nicotinamidase-related amidase
VSGRPRPWDGLISAEEIAVYKRAGFFREVELGERPALLVIDAQYNFTGERAEPVAAATESYRFSCGEHAWESLPHLVELLDLARSKGMPVVYTQDMETFPDPTPAEAERGNEIVAELAPREGDAVIEKQGYSGFFATRMLSYLVSLNVDTAIVCGGTTSGCVRATVTDAFDYRFKTFVVEECVFDRAPLPHRMNLFDMAGKAARVIGLTELTELLAGRDFHDAFPSIGDSRTWRYVKE